MNKKLDTFQRIRELPMAHKMALSGYLCERMLPNYEIFVASAGWGETKVLRGALNAAWDKMAVGKGADWQRWQEKIEEVTPSEQQFDVLGVYPAMEACTALSSLLQGVEDSDSSALLDVAKISQASVSHFLELSEFADMDAETREAELRNHPLMNYEIDIQQAMISMLEDEAVITREVVREIRQIARDEGHSSLGLNP